MANHIEKTIEFLQDHCQDPEQTIRLSTKEILAAPIEKGVHITQVIAEGGMGVVFEGEQGCPKRLVAIKKSKKQTHANQQQLLQEAMIVGALEHPNIIPVHQILIEEDGPSVVMKRVRGDSFKERIKKGCTIHEALQIMLPVCNALEYAHSQGIVHRDIKPSNIMIGYFGEVYLLDWGLAITLGDVPPTGIVGSPSFMAPEMLEANAHSVTEKTDVYLLGATLHYAITKKARHTGKDIRIIVDQIQRSETFQYDINIPESLGQLLNSSCSKTPQKRPLGVREFRQKIEEILQHWPALQLIQEAQQRAFEVAQIATCEIITPEQIQSCHQIFTLARQDFEYSLRIWPDNPSATQGLEQLLLNMIGIHLEQKEYAAALLLYRNLSHLDPTLLTEIQRQKEQNERLDSEQRRLLELGEAHDFLSAQEASAPFAALIALAAVLIALWSNYAYVIERQPLSQELLLMSGVAVLVIVCVLIFYRKESLLQNKAAKGMYTEVIGTMIMISCNRLVGIQYGLAVEAIMSIDCFIIAFATLSIWPIIFAGELLTILCFLIGTISVLYPMISLTCLSFITMITPTYTWYAWKKGAKERGITE